MIIIINTILEPIKNKLTEAQIKRKKSDKEKRRCFPVYIAYMEVLGMKANLVPLYFDAANEREMGEFSEQVQRLKDMYGDVAEFMEPICVGGAIPEEADAAVFPQLIGAAFKEADALIRIDLPFIVLTSKYGTVEMWDWEIVSYLREKGMNVFSPYSIELAKVVIRSIAAKEQLRQGAKFLMFQDSPGEGMQAYIFKRFYWWEEECTRKMSDAFGMKLVYKSWKQLAEDAKAIQDIDAEECCKDWDINKAQDLSHRAYLSAVKLYMAAKAECEKEGNVVGIGCNCLNESFYSDSTPCLAWNMLFERDGIIFACEGDTLTLLSNYMIYESLRAPFMMSNVYPFLVGMAALAHEKIDKFPDIEDSDNHALVVHCGYFGLVARQFCTEWTLRPKVLEIVDENAVVVDCRFPTGLVTMAKINSDFKHITIIEAEIEDYVQYPGSDCRNGALLRYKDGHKVMESLSSHHAILISGDRKNELLQMAKVFGLEPEVI